MRRRMRPSEAFCREILPKVSRTFALGIEVLPDRLRLAVRTAYLLCRIADTVEDDPALAGAVKRERLGCFVRVLRNRRAGRRAAEEFAASCADAQGDAESLRLLAAAPEVFEELRRLPARTQGILERHVGELALGMAEYCGRQEAPGERAEISTVEDLDRYCYYVAGTVGLALTELFVAYVKDLDADREAALRARAVGFGRGLQMVNILKDVTKDFARRWVYLPSAVLEAHGVDAGALHPARVGAAGLRAVEALVERALRSLDEAEEYLRLIPRTARRVRLFCAWPLFFAVKTLARVRGNPEVFAGGTVKISRADVASIIETVRSRVRSDRALHELYLTLRGEAAGTTA